MFEDIGRGPFHCPSSTGSETPMTWPKLFTGMAVSKPVLGALAAKESVEGLVPDKTCQLVEQLQFLWDRAQCRLSFLNVEIYRSFGWCF